MGGSLKKIVNFSKCAANVIKLLFEWCVRLSEKEEEEELYLVSELHIINIYF